MPVTDTNYDAVASGVPVAIVSGAGTLGASLDALTTAEGLLKASVDLLKAATDALAAVTSGPSTAVYTGTVTAPVNGGTAVIIGTQACKAVRLQAPVGNNQSILYGSAVGTCTMELVAGAVSAEIAVSNVNLIFVKSAGAATQTVNWLARN
jgi:hypothetical protein